MYWNSLFWIEVIYSSARIAYGRLNIFSTSSWTYTSCLDSNSEIFSFNFTQENENLQHISSTVQEEKNLSSCFSLTQIPHDTGIWSTFSCRFHFLYIFFYIFIFFTFSSTSSFSCLKKILKFASHQACIFFFLFWMCICVIWNFLLKNKVSRSGFKMSDPVFRI